MRSESSFFYKFGPITVEPAERRIWRDSNPLQLTPKAFDTLLVLIANNGHIVEKETLLSEVWPDTFVEESNLAQNIFTLRKTLGTNENGSQFIETIPRKGYRLATSVDEVSDEIRPLTNGNGNGNGHAHTNGTAAALTEPALTEPQVKQSDSRSIVGWIKWGVPAALLLGSLTFLIAWRLATPPPMVADRFNRTEIKKLTSTGDVSLVKASADGQYFALVESSHDGSSLRLRQAENPNTIEIVPPKHQRFLGISFSPDSSCIYYVTYPTDPPPDGLVWGHLYKVATLGGPVEEVLTDIDSPIAIAPDGRHFAFIRHDLKNSESRMMIGDLADRGDVKQLVSRRLAERFSSSDLAWSPNGKTIAAVVMLTRRTMGLVGVGVDTGEIRQIGDMTWSWASSPNWMSDGSGVVLAAYGPEAAGQTDEIWQLTYPDGKARRVAGTIHGVLGLSLTSNSRTLVAVQSQILSSFWVAPGGNVDRAVKVTQDLPDYDLYMPGMTWTPDGKIIYASSLNGDLDLWAMNSDGSGKRQITTDPAADSMPVSGGDGQYIFFVSNRSGKRNIWQMRLDGSEKRQLTNEEEVATPSISADGKDLFYSALDPSSGNWLLRRYSLSSGEVSHLSDTMAVAPQASPDGKLVACYFPNVDEQEPTSQLKLTILSTETGKAIHQWDSSTTEFGYYPPIAWSDDHTITYASSTTTGSQLWRRNIDGGEAKLILDSPNERITRLTSSPTTHDLAYEKGTSVNDVVLIRSAS